MTPYPPPYPVPNVSTPVPVETIVATATRFVSNFGTGNTAIQLTSLQTTDYPIIGSFIVGIAVGLIIALIIMAYVGRKIK